MEYEYTVESDMEKIKELIVDGWSVYNYNPMKGGIEVSLKREKEVEES